MVTLFIFFFSFKFRHDAVDFKRGTSFVVESPNYFYKEEEKKPIYFIMKK